MKKVSNYSALLPTATLSTCILVFATRGNAQPRVVSPRAFADVEAPDVANLTNFPSYRLQQVYDASDFSSLGPGPHLITRVDWRADGDVTEPLNYPSPDWRLSLSTTNVAPGSLSATFGDNVGADEQVVVSGSVTLETMAKGPASGPKVFDYGVEFDVPFAYDPSQGNLLMDLTVNDGQGPLLLDFIFAPSDTTSFYWTGELGVDSLVGDTGQFGGQLGGHIAQFTIVPEPITCTLLLGAAAVGGLGWLLRKRQLPNVASR